MSVPEEDICGVELDLFPSLGGVCSLMLCDLVAGQKQRHLSLGKRLEDKEEPAESLHQ